MAMTVLRVGPAAPAEGVALRGRRRMSESDTSHQVTRSVVSEINTLILFRLKDWYPGNNARSIVVK